MNKWRRGRDSNPGSHYQQDNGLATHRFKPLSHLSNDERKNISFEPSITYELKYAFCLDFGGGSRIRTHGPVSRTAVFKTAAFVHSAIPPEKTAFSYTVPFKSGKVGFRSSLKRLYSKLF